MKRLSLGIAAGVLAVAMAAPSYAGEIADLKAQNEALARQVEVLTKKVQTLMDIAGARGAAKEVTTVPAAAAAPAAPPPKKMVSSGSHELDVLAKEVQTLRDIVEARAAAKEAANPAQPPPKKMVTSGKEAVKLTVSGQVNRMVLFADDGVEDEIFHVDNVNSGTRVRFVGKARLSPEWSSGIRVEFNLRENRSDKVCIQTGDRAKAECDKGVAGADKDAAFDTSERFLEWTVTSKTLGKLYIGQGDTASNSTNHVNFSGTLMPDFTGAQLVGGGI